jgi:bidirectional [NiFe] hydrogenase diaphorase subunit
MVKFTSLCGLGQSAPNPVLSTLRYFRDEYLALLRDGDGAAPVTPAT